MSEARTSAAASSAAPVVPIVAIVVGVILVVLGQFVLDHLADTSDTWHFIQHGVLFVGGLGVGGGVVALFRSGQRRV
jgi:multisubunit Na+/H+ antiporter MnhB subunit